MTPEHGNTYRRPTLGLLGAASLLLFCALPASALAHPVLEEAERAYANQDYRRVVQLVRPLVEPRSVLATEDEEAQAFRLLALSYWWLKDYKASEANFLILLSMRPNLKLNPAVHPPGLIRFFNKIRDRFRHKPFEIRRRQVEELKACRRELKRTKRANETLKRHCVERVVVRRSLWPNFLPFGIGQFNNGDTTKGWIFLGVELGFLLINATAYVLAETDWVRNGPAGTVRNDEESIKRARAVQIVQVTSGALLAVTALAGIIEAVVSYRPKRVVVRKRLQVGRLRLGAPSWRGPGFRMSWDLE